MQRQLLACVGVSACVYAAYKYKALQTEVGGAPEATCLFAHPGAGALTWAVLCPYD